MLAPSINIKQTRSPGCFPGAALIGNRVTGPSLCMKNTALKELSGTTQKITVYSHSTAECWDFSMCAPAPPELPAVLPRCGTSPHARQITFLLSWRAVTFITEV
jgi:hypothetical protein